MQSAPSSINGQQVTVITVQDKERKKKISELAGGQPWIDQAPVFLLFCADFNRAKIALEDLHASAETVPLKEFEKEIFFEGCMPIEVMAKRGKKTMLFGPMKPVGLEHPVTGKRPYAVVQLRQDDAAGTLYNIVGFQTHLKWGDQKEVLKLIPNSQYAEKSASSVWNTRHAGREAAGASHFESECGCGKRCRAEKQ